MDNRRKRKLILGSLGIALALTSGLVLLGDFSSGRPDLDLDSVPLRIGEWEGRRVALKPGHPARVGGVGAVYVSYLKGGRKVDLYIVEAAAGGFSLHPPEYCLVGGLSKEVSRSRLRLPWSGGVLEVNRFQARRAWRHSLVYYWYCTGRGYTPSFFRLQLSNLWRRLTGTSAPTALVRLSWDGSEGLEETEKAFREFVRDAFGEISPLLLSPEAKGG